MIKIILPLLLISSGTLRADNGEYLEASVEESNALYYTGPGTGCQDGIFNAVSSSMIGWGVGLAAAIALITGLIHTSHSDSN